MRRKSKQRVEFIDIAKGYAIVAVVIGHSGSPLHNFIYLFHMALFIFISGYFYKNKYSLSPIEVIYKRIKTLYLPFLKYQLLFLLAHNLLYKLNIYSNKFVYNGYVDKLYTFADYKYNFVQILLFNETERIANIFWFFTVLFEVNVIFVLISYVISKLFEKHMEIIRFTLVGILFLIGNLLSILGMHIYNRLDIAFSVTIFFLLGYLFKQYEKYIIFKLVYFIICFIFLIINSFYTHIELIANEYTNNVLLLTNSLSGIYCIMYIAKRTVNSKFDFIKIIGIQTIPIAGLHFLSFKLVNLLQVTFFGLPLYYIAKFPILDGSYGLWIIYSIFGIIIPLTVVYIINVLKSKMVFITLFNKSRD